MTLPDSTPKLPKWFFLLSDALLVGVAAFLASHSATPLSNTVIFSIVGCVAVGAIVTAWAFIADYTRKQDEALDDRQRALEALARTVASSAEQISVAASGLHQVAELAQKNLRHAEQLPHKLQDKIAEFQAQLANASDTEREELEKELVALRASESERLESISDKVAKSASEWARLESAMQKHLVAAADAVTKAQAGAVGAVDEKFAASLAALDARLAACTVLVERALESASHASPGAVLPPPAAAPETAPGGVELTTAHPPKRPRKPRREDAAAEEPAAETPPASTAAAPSAVAPAGADPKSEIAPPQLEEPPPVLVEKISEIAPVAPHTAEPFTGHVTDTPPAEPASAPAPAPADVPSPAKPPRKRAARKPVDAPAEASAESAPQGDPALDLHETPAAQSAELVERVLTSDGATRLLVTAYIGIGNRLFIRGAGPGLSWEKGVPLQFVSIGKWRWETAEASAPVQFKLYKNDAVECTALGAQALDAGYQQEVTAAF